MTLLQLEGPKHQTVNKQQEEMKAGETGSSLTSSDLKLLPCMPCFQKASTLSWRHTAKGKHTVRAQHGSSEPRKPDFPPAVTTWRTDTAKPDSWQKNPTPKPAQNNWTEMTIWMGEFLKRSSKRAAQTLLARQATTGISLFFLFSLSLLFSGSFFF